MPAPALFNNLSLRAKEALIRAVIWAFIGSLYGMVFKFFFSMADYAALPGSPLLTAGTLAATLAALIYSSMTLAFIVASASSLISLVYVLFAGEAFNLATLSLICAVFGAVAGAIYGAIARSSRVYRADSKMLAGFSSGIIVSLLFVGLTQLLEIHSLVLTVALLCFFTGALYIFIVSFFIGRFDGLLPPIGDGALVGAGTALFISLLFALMITGVTPEIAGEHRLLVEIIRHDFLGAIFGGTLGAGLAGAVSGWTLRNWLDL